MHITSHNDDGKAIIKSSDQPKAELYPEHRFTSTNVYTLSAIPTDLNDDIDIKEHQDLVAEGNLGIVRANGTVIRFADFAPGSKGFIHRTQSLDFGVVLEGTIVLELDNGSMTEMMRGDVAVQRATMHAWHNPSETEWARLLFVLQDCKPLIVNGKPVKEDLGVAHEIVRGSGK